MDPEILLYNELVTVSGTVKYFGYYARTPGLKLSSIVTADQMLPSTNRFYAELTRYRGDGYYEYVTFSPKDVIDGKYDMDMRALDDIRFVQATYLKKNPDFRLFSQAVAIYGPGKNPGMYSWKNGMKLSSIFGANSVASDTNLFYGEIERRLPDGRFTFLTFIPKDIVSGKQDVELIAQDVIRLIPADTEPSYANKDRYPGTITVEGKIDRTGLFAWRMGLMLSEIVDTSTYRMDTNLEYAEIRRSAPTGDSIITFSPRDLFSRSASATLTLEPRDSVLFFPKYYKAPVTISGEVKVPKVIPYFDGMTMLDTLRAIEFSQDPKDLKAVLNRSDGQDVVIYLDDLLFRQSGSSVPLLAGDRIILQKLLPDERSPQVLVRGAVKNPMAIAWKQGLRLSDALKTVGGYGENAYPKGLVLIRKTAAAAQQLQVERLMTSLDAVSQEAKSAAVTGSALGALEGGVTLVNLQLDLMTQKSQLADLKQLGKEGFGRLNLDLPSTLQALKGNSEDILVERDDAIFVPTTPSYVLVIGQVNQQSVLAFRKGMTVSDAIADSGWGTNSADTRSVSVLHANGKVSNYSNRGFLFFRPNILELALEPGDAVLVPRAAVRVNSTWAYIKDSVSIIYQLVTATVSTLKILGF
jgi:polysaccharide export outer membrane protein